MEQYNPNVDKLKAVVGKVEELHFDINNLKKVVISHSMDINKLIQK